MKDNYLWDGSGEPDPEIQRLENILGRFRHNRPAPAFPERVGLVDRLRLWLRRFDFRSPSRATVEGQPRMALAGVAALAAAGAVVLLWQANSWQETPRKEARTGGQESPSSTPAWNVAPLQGTARIGSKQISGLDHLGLGEWLETDAASRVKIEVSSVGQLEIEPNTRVRLVESRTGRHRVALAHGTLRATIWAPPRQFVVDTPSAMAVDLGCAYTLHVDDSGAGLIRVTWGWVGFERGGREAFIPAGAVCATRPKVGPGTPYFADAPSELRAALSKLDFENSGPPARADALQVILKRARQRDAFTLWHLLSRANDQERGPVFDRLATLVPPPKGVTRDRILRLDQPMLDLWWNQLGLRDTSWWRMWERPWPEKIR